MDSKETRARPDEGVNGSTADEPASKRVRLDIPLPAVQNGPEKQARVRVKGVAMIKEE